MYDCQYRASDGTVCHADHAYAEHIRSLPVSEQTATHNMDGTPFVPAWRKNLTARDDSGTLRATNGYNG